jgi:glycogen synthase
MPLTVLHVLDHSVPIFSGYSFRSQSIVRAEAARGLRPVVLTSPKHGSEREGIETIDAVRYHRTARAGRALPFVGEIRQMLRMARRISAVAREERARIIHAHSPLLNGLPALWVGRRLGIPVVYEARAFWEDAAVDHGTMREGSARYRLSRALETWLYRGANHVVTICDGMRQELVRRGIDGRRITVVPNGVDANAFHPRPRNEALAHKLGLAQATVFGFIGSFYRYEGLRFLVECATALRAAVPGARVLLIGGGEEESALRALAAPLDDLVVFPGRVPHDEIADFYSVIDVFVCPRRRLRITELVTPLKPLEAMAMSKPVVASDVGGHRELIEDDVTGLLFKAESAPAFVAQAERVGLDAALRSKLGAAGRSFVLANRTWERIVPQYMDVYASVA